MTETELANNLEHSRAAYTFSVNSLPTLSGLKFSTVRKNGLEFSHESQVHSMLVELGWAFFCRYEACLEKFLKDKDVQLSRRKSLRDWLEENEITIPTDFQIGIEEYRQLRNALHHDDGASPDGEADREIHLLPEHMERFFNLFVWIEQQVEKVNKRSDALQ